MRIASSVFVVLLTCLMAKGAIEGPAVADMIADAQGIVPGQPIRVGILFVIKPGWHLYWKYAGETGLPTHVEWKLPEGFVAADLSWPTPASIDLGDNKTGPGYSETLLLFATIQTPKSLKVGDNITLGAKASWLACKEACIPGEQKLEVSLPVVGDKAKPDNADLFKEWTGKLPVKIESAAAVATAKIAGALAQNQEPAKFSVDVTWNQVVAGVSFFPDAGADVYLEQLETKAQGNHTLITFSARRVKDVAPRTAMETVVTYTDTKGARHGLLIPIPLSQ